VGDLTAAGEARLSGLLSDGRAKFDGSDYGGAATTFRALVNAVGQEATGASRAGLEAKGEELVAWAKGLR
jgi:hypothetical protein